MELVTALQIDSQMKRWDCFRVSLEIEPRSLDFTCSAFPTAYM